MLGLGRGGIRTAVHREHDAAIAAVRFREETFSTSHFREVPSLKTKQPLGTYVLVRDTALRLVLLNYCSAINYSAGPS
jgi:hypothetical protein